MKELDYNYTCLTVYYVLLVNINIAYQMNFKKGKTFVSLYFCYNYIEIKLFFYGIHFKKNDRSEIFFLKTVFDNHSKFPNYLFQYPEKMPICVTRKYFDGREKY